MGKEERELKKGANKKQSIHMIFKLKFFYIKIVIKSKESIYWYWGLGNGNGDFRHKPLRSIIFQSLELFNSLFRLVLKRRGDCIRELNPHER